MKSSHIEKNLSYRLVNTVEISVNTVVVIIKMGLSSRHEVYMSKRLKYASPLIKTIDILGERTGLMVRALDSGSGDPGSILGRVGVLFP